MKRIALYHLETLIWIARLGTFEAAARRMNTTQPSVSGRMRELEAQLGVALFRREGRRMVLTVKGREVVRRCEDLWMSFEQSLLAPHNLSGTIRIGAGEIAAVSRIPDYLSGIQREFPALSFEVEIDLSANLLQRLMASNLDIVFLPGEVAWPGLRAIPIGSIALSWFGSPQLRDALPPGASLADCDLPVWSLPAHSPLYHVMAQSLGAAGLRKRTIHYCNNVQAIVRLLEAGSGIAILPHMMAHPFCETGTLSPLFEADPLPTLGFHAAIRAQEKEAAVLALFDRVQRMQSIQI